MARPKSAAERRGGVGGREGKRQRDKCKGRAGRKRHGDKERDRIEGEMAEETKHREREKTERVVNIESE